MTFLTPHFAEVEQGLTPNPVPLLRLGGPGGFEINNSEMSAIVVTIIVIAFVQIAMRQPKLVPTGLQNFVEWLVEFMVTQLENLMGHETTIRGFWYFGGLFTFIFLSNLFGLIPGVGTFGWGHVMNGHFQVTQPFLRGANANDNLTAAYTAVFFFMFFYWCFRKLGFWGFLVHTFGTKVKFENKLAHWLFIFIFFMVGWVEVFSIFVVRPIAFTFRLYGNIFGGEYLLDSMYKMMPNFAFIALVPFYFYELLVAFVQSLVFLLLTAAFTGMFTNTPEHGDEAHKHH